MSATLADTFREHWPVALRDAVVGVLPEPLQWLASGVLAVVAILAVFGLFFAFLTLAERKLIGRFQNRPGPNRSGLPWFKGVKLFGLTQPFADAIKALTKEDTVPDSADKILHFLAPVVLVGFALTTFAVIPYGRNLVALDLDASLLFFFAAGGATELSIFMAGWGSRNKYSLFAAMRALAQLISYELPLLLSAVPVVLVTGSLALTGIVAAQGHWSLGGVLPHWNVFTPWGFAGFVIFYIASLAESNRCPFDSPEAESELIAGHLMEYSGFKYALFFMAEYFGLIALCGVAVSLFLGGWQAPCEFLQFIPSYAWYGLKLVAMLFSFIWIRATLLRLRIDQLTRLSWKLLTPLALINLGNAAFWSLTAGWTGPLWFVRLLVGLVIAAVPFIALGRRLGAGLGPRTYRYAT